MEDLKAPFPWAGGKSRIADAVWSRLGNVDNYVEPFMGSAAVLLRRPAEHFADGYRVETVNDASHYLVNFWRAVKSAPAKVAEWADWPVAEADLHARHRWLVHSEHVAGWRERMRTDPEHFDAKIAGWWCWGVCCWIGSGWCNEGVEWVQRMNLDPNDHGVCAGLSSQVPHMDAAGRGDTAPGGKRNALGNAPCVTQLAEGRPQLCDAFDIGRGVNSGGLMPTTRPQLTSAYAPGEGVDAFAGSCDARREWLTNWMQRLSDRLRLVRTCYGHWSRICDSDSTLTRLGTVGVFLDPPYPIRSTSGKKSRAEGLYANDKGQDLDALRDEVLEWCRKWGSDKQIRIAVCGYEGDGYESLLSEGWTEQAWEAGGGYGNQKKGKGKAANAKRERIWYSPACVAADLGLFNEVEDAA